MLGRQVVSQLVLWSIGRHLRHYIGLVQYRTSTDFYVCTLLLTQINVRRRCVV